MPIIKCATSLPLWLCEHRNVLAYLAPSLFLAIVFRLLARRHPVFFGFYLSGTILHELTHLLAGWVTNARPINFTVIPRRASDNQWILGSVSFANIRWYNAAFVGLAPFLILFVPVFVAVGRAETDQAYEWMDLGIAILIAPAYLSFLPSRIDLMLALRSWPYGVAAGCWLGWIGR